MSTILQDNNGNLSSKRLSGMIVISVYLIIVIVSAIYSIKTGNDLGNNVTSLVNGLGLTGAGLLGVGVLENIGKNKGVSK